MIGKLFAKRFVWRALAGFISCGALVRADVLPPDACLQGQKVGAACETFRGQSGVCQPAKCNRINYTAQGPSGVVEYDCLKCVETNDDGGSGRNGGSGGSGGSGATETGSVARAVGPWFLAGLFSVPLFIKRRRRNERD